MKRLYAITIFLIVLKSVYAQQWLWAQQQSQSEVSWFAEMKVSPDGKIFTAVSSQNSWPNTIKGHVVVTGYTTNGQKMWEDTIQTQQALFIKLYFFNNNLYLLANFSNTVQIGNTLLTSDAPTGFQNSFIICYSTTGSINFIKHLKSSSDVETNALYCDSLNNLYLTGCFTNSCYFEDDSLISVKGKRDLFIAQYSSNGSLTRFLQAYSTNTVYIDSRVQGENILVNRQGNLVVNGSFNAGMVFNNLVDSFFGDEPYRDFILTINPSDFVTHSFFETEGGVSISSEDYYFDDVNYLHMMKHFWYAHGSWSNIIKFDTNLVAKDTISFSNRSGSYFAGSCLTDYTMNKLKIYFVGKRSENYTPDEECDFNFLSIGKYDLNYNVEWMDSTVDNKDAYYSSIGCDTLNNIYLFGIFKNSLFIAGTNLSAPSNTEQTFLAKLKDREAPGIKKNQGNELFTIAPNPSSGMINIRRTKFSSAQITVFDSKGNNVYSGITNDAVSTVNLENFLSGIYLVELKDDYSVSTKKIIKQ